MSNLHVENAVIESTRLGVPCSDHGILTFSIMLDYGGTGQGFGGISLDTYDKTKNVRVATDLAASLLLAVNEVFGVDWEDLPGISCRTYCPTNTVFALGHFLKDKWLWLDKETKQYRVTPLNQVGVYD